MATVDSVSEWSADQVGDFIAGLGKALAQYRTAFVDNGVDGSLFLDLTSDDLADMGVSSNLHKKKLISEIAKIKASPTASTAPASVAVAPPVAYTH